MKKSIYILLFALLVSSACDDGFAEMNVNPTKPTQVSLNNKLTAVVTYISGERYENWRAQQIYQSTMMQQQAALAGYWSGDKYLWNKGYASSLMDRYYGNAIKSLEDMLIQVDAEEQPAEMKSIIRILRVFAFSRLTDLYGDIPYSEAGKGFIDGILKPKYDAQSEIYADMLKELEESAAALGSGTSQFGSADVIFHGDLGKWQRFAYSMMLRLGFRLMKVDEASSKAWVTKALAGGVMNSNDDIAFNYHDNNVWNGNSSVYNADGNPRLSKTFVDFLQAGNDPRLPVLAQRRGDGSTDPADLKGLPNGWDSSILLEETGEENTNNYAEINRGNLAAPEAPMFYQTYAEVEFMQAEAAVRWGIGSDPEGHYNNGVEAAMQMLALYPNSVAITGDQISTYLAANPYDAANAIEQINTQYWAATFMNWYETFSNWRRTGFPVLVPTNYPGNVTGGTIPRRLTWSTSEQSNNTENYDAAVAAQGADELTTRVWWDVN